ncbi:MAG: PTS transporter subunit EIIC [Erysipelotrichaceae bacterium]|nr:PTS transporter subunit EIIC [Erysipelotrichaceae bacterium]
MRNWRSYYEILKFPLEMVFMAVILGGIGNILTNPALGISAYVTNDYVKATAEVLLQSGRYIVVYFPFIFMLRLVTRRSGSGMTILSAIAGYAIYLYATIFFTGAELPITAYSSILGISVSHSSIPILNQAVHYPLQTGIIGAAIVAAITNWSYNRSRKRNEDGIFGFVTKEASVAIRTVFFCGIAGALISFVWPFAVNFIQRIIRFITVDTSNPVNLGLFGIMNRLLGVLNLGTLIRAPFWYGNNGGSWVNMAGVSIAGDVNIWSAQLQANALVGMAGRFFTPYYILNIFAVPGMIWAMFSLQTDAIQRRKRRIFCLIATVASLLCGVLLPLELMLALLCPLLFVFHLVYTGLLYAVCQSMHIYLGYSSTEASTISAFPGSLPEYLNYIQYPSLSKTLMYIAIIGIISLIIYFLVTRLYFKRMAVDLFDSGNREKLIRGTIKAVGGIENIKMTQSGIANMTIGVYDPNKVDMNRLRKLGTYRIYESRAGYVICFGAGSTMIRNGIQSAMREGIRAVNTN